jgi:hypothetical protein
MMTALHVMKVIIIGSIIALPMTAHNVTTCGAGNQGMIEQSIRIMNMLNLMLKHKAITYLLNAGRITGYVLMIVFLIFVLIPADLHAMGVEFYTVQTGSFTRDSVAAKQFNSLLKGLAETGRENLRIEKIGDFYAVRVGKFRDRISADRFLRARAAQLEGAIVVKATYRDDRVVKLYTPVSPVKSAEADTVSPLPSENAATIQIIQKKESSKGPDIVTSRVENHNAEDTENNAVSAPPSPRKETVKKTKKYSGIKGRFYISDYYSNDSNNFDFHVLSARLKVYMRESDESRYYFKLDARARKKVSDNDVHNDIPEYKFYELWLGYKFLEQNIDLIAGRQHVQEMYNTNVDGINAKYRIRDYLGIGIFGGLAPDKYDYSFNSKFKTAGIYSFLDRDRYKLRFGYEKLYYDGKTDREYLSFKLFSDFNKKTWFNLLSSASINQVTDKIDIDNLSTNLLYKYSKDLRMSLFFNYYRAIRYFESSKKFITQNDGDDSYYLDTNSQSRIGFRVNYRLRKKLTIYASMAYQQREIDNESATRFTGGIRKYDLYGFNLSGRYTHINNFTSKSNEFNVEVSRLLLEKMDVSVYASHEQEELEIENGFTAGLLTYGASVYWAINRHYFLSMFLERYDEDDYDNTSLFTQAGYRF